jgi:hypothetical protein
VKNSTCPLLYLKVKLVHRKTDLKGRQKMNAIRRRRYSEATIAQRHPDLYERLTRATADAIARRLGLVE